VCPGRVRRRSHNVSWVGFSASAAGCERFAHVRKRASWPACPASDLSLGPGRPGGSSGRAVLSAGAGSRGDNALVESPQPPRVPFDAVRYVQWSREGPCFVCAILAGHPGYPRHDVYEDAATIAFLARQPTLLGYCIVAPKRHVEYWVGGLGEEEYLALQRVVSRVAGAVAAVVPAERMYSLSLGSRQGNAHLHWHVAPLPPGVPYERQQYYALMSENGVLDVDDSSQEGLARAIRSRL